MKSRVGKKILTIVVLIIVFAIAITGCGKKDDGDKVVATLGDEKIYLKEANFYARISQMSMESQYLPYFGEEMWQTDLYGDGKTLEQSTKDSVMEYQIKQVHIMAAHAKDYNVELTEEDLKEIEDTAKEVMESWDEALIEATGATQEYVEEILKTSVTANKVYEAAVADVDTEVSDEEAAQKTISYAFLSTAGVTDEEGNTTELTEEEVAAVREQAQAIVDNARANGDFDTAVGDAGFTAYAASFGKNSTTMDAAVIAAAENLAEKDVADVVETAGGYFVLQLVSNLDEEATAAEKQNIVSQRQNEAFTEIFEKWMAEVEFIIMEDVWATVTFDTPIVTQEAPAQELNPLAPEGEETGTEETGTEETEAPADGDESTTEETDNTAE